MALKVPLTGCVDCQKVPVTASDALPTVTVGVLELVHAIAHSRHAFGVAVVLTLGAIEAGLCVLMWRAFGRMAGLAFLVLDTPLYYLAVTRVDVVSVALATLSLALVVGRRPVGAGVAWVAARKSP